MLYLNKAPKQMYPVFHKRNTKIGEKSDTKVNPRFCSTKQVFIAYHFYLFTLRFFLLLVVLFIHLDCFGLSLSCRVLRYWLQRRLPSL